MALSEDNAKLVQQVISASEPIVLMTQLEKDLKRQSEFLSLPEEEQYRIKKWSAFE